MRRLPERPDREVSFIARTAEFTPPVIYSLEERNKLVFMVEALPDDSPRSCASGSRSPSRSRRKELQGAPK